MVTPTRAKAAPEPRAILLIAILRQHFIVSEQESGIGTTVAQVAVDDLIPQLQVYLGDLGSDAKSATAFSRYSIS